MTSPTGKRWLVFAAKGLVSIALLGAAICVLDWRQLVEVLGRLNAGTITIAVVLVVAQFVAMGVRWWLMVRQAAPLPTGRHLAIYLSANLVNSFTPANLGGDAYRVIALRRYGDTVQLVVLLARERLLGLGGFLSVYLFSAIGMWMTVPALRSDPMHPMNLCAAAAVAGLGVMAAGRPLMRWLSSGSWVTARPRVEATARHTASAFGFESAGQAAALVLLTWLAITLWAAAAWVIAEEVSPGVPIAAVCAVVVFAEVVRLVPITVQGVGVREGAFAFGFAALGHDAEAGFAVGAATYLVLAAVLLATGAAGWAMTRGGTPSDPAPRRDPD